MTSKIGRTNFNKLQKAHMKLFELTGTMATLGLPYNEVSGIVEGLTAVVQDVAELVDAVEVVDSGRGRPRANGTSPPVDDPRTPEQRAADEADGITVVQ
tara:strand:+ start:1625 stop:1921 length:297 start_codon:yes stop_codon:yes gene_type:complete